MYIMIMNDTGNTSLCQYKPVESYFSFSCKQLSCDLREVLDSEVLCNNFASSEVPILIREIWLMVREKSWKSQGKKFVQVCGNPGVNTKEKKGSDYGDGSRVYQN